ncbi:MAG: TetR/AcrR family transcriptional regulator [Lautropia sp.]|nr:TetR/AcrR family transcriptional regulator [Lautropia sp.]
MDTRQQILIAAHDLFYREGFHACGVELLAQRAGTTKRTLYAHFGSKEGLIDAVLAYRHQRFIDSMQAALEKRPPSQTDQAYLDFIIAWTRSNDFHGCMFINASAEYADEQTMPHQHAARHKAQIRDILLSRLKAGGVSQAKAAAEMLFLIGEGMIVAAQTGQQPLKASMPAILRAIRQLGSVDPT